MRAVWQRLPPTLARRMADHDRLGDGLPGALTGLAHADVQLLHQHAGSQALMRLVRTDRVDHLLVQNFRCACGSERAVLARVEVDEDPHELRGWPITRGPARDTTS